MNQTSSGLSGMSFSSDYSLGPYFQLLAIIFLILTALFLLLHFIRSRHYKNGGKKKKGAHIFLETRFMISPKQSLLVVHFMDQRLLLGVTEQNISLLQSLPLKAGIDEPEQQRAALRQEKQPEQETNNPSEDFERFLEENLDKLGK